MQNSRYGLQTSTAVLISTCIVRGEFISEPPCGSVQAVLMRMRDILSIKSLPVPVPTRMLSPSAEDHHSHDSFVATTTTALSSSPGKETI